MNKPLNLFTTLVSALLLGALAFLAVRGIIDPTGGAAAFGVPATDTGAKFYHSVYRDRNLVLAVTGLIFLATSMWRALAILSTVAITLPIYDMAALVRADVPVRLIHPATLASLIALSILLFIRVRADASGQAGR